MKTVVQLFVLMAVIALGVNSHAQSTMRRVAQPNAKSFNTPVKRTFPNEFGEPRNATTVNDNFPSAPLSPLVTIPGADQIPVTGRFYNQTNGRGLHNIQVDPTNPMNIHAVIMTTTAPPENFHDTDGGALPSRRSQYTFSSDGGKHWSAPVSIGNVRTGYPDMILVNRNGKYVPIIAAHRYQGTSTSLFICAIYIEQGDPGTGNFKEVLTDRHSSQGGDKDLLWPTIALSKDSKKLFIIGDFSNQASATAQDNMEFGSYTMSADLLSATFDGWTAAPGAALGNTEGYSSSGGHCIRVADNGTVGISWVNPDAAAGDHGIYFLESSDNGQTWPQTFTQFVPPVNDLDNSRGIVPGSGLDFFYDGNTPHFTWQGEEHIIGQPDSNGYYFPYTGSLFYWAPGDTSLLCLNSKAPAYNILSIKMGGGDAISTTYLYESDYWDPANIPQGIDFPIPSTISYPTFARTNDPKIFGIFYQTIVDNDFATVNDVDKDQWFTSIYYQATKDGGVTWTAPTPFKVNPPETPIESHLDYRYPQTPYNSGSGNFLAAFAADSVAGSWTAGGGGWSDVTWWAQTIGTGAVRDGKTINSTLGLGQNYPNPVTENTVIPVNLLNNEMVTITIEDMLGRTISTVFNGAMSSGSHNVKLSATSLPAGVYRYTIRTRTESDSRLMTIVR